MSQFAVVIFGNEAKACEGGRVIAELHADSGLVLFGQAVIVKDLAGTVSLRDGASGGTVGSGVRALAGRLIGGPVGSAMGLAVGSYGDLLDAGVLASFVQKVADALKPGTTAIVAEIAEDRVGPLNAQMHALGGHVLRSCSGDSEGDEIARATARQVANIGRLNAEYAQATLDANTPREMPLDAATLALDERARITQSIVRANAEARSAKLNQACGPRKDVLD